MARELQRRSALFAAAAMVTGLFTACTVTGSGGDNCTPGGTIGADGSPSIMGSSTLTPEQMADWYNEKRSGNLGVIPNAPSVEEFIGGYINNPEGVRGDIAFIQAVHETGDFTNGDSAINNFAGIAHYDHVGSGTEFANWQEGISSQIQLLKRVVMGNDAPLTAPIVTVEWKGENVDTWGGLTGNWATDPEYWPKLSTLYNDALSSAGEPEISTGGGSCSGSGTFDGDISGLDAAYQAALGAPIPPPGEYVADPWNFFRGECVSFVAYMVRTYTEHKDFNNHYKGVHWGNARNWDDAAIQAGIPVGDEPRVGSVAVHHRTSAGHVAWVTAVHGDGTYDIVEYNVDPRKFSSATGKGPGDFDKFVYF